MSALTTQVKNGRIFVDEPTTLPEGTVVELRPAPEVKESAQPSKMRRSTEPRGNSIKNENQLSWEEIKALYPDEWVILVDLLYTDPSDPNVVQDICGGVVFAHGKKRDELLRSTNDALAGISSAFFFTGKMNGHLLRWGK